MNVNIIVPVIIIIFYYLANIASDVPLHLPHVSYNDVNILAAMKCCRSVFLEKKM